VARWQYRDAALLWWFLPAYLAHLAEELWAGEGLPRWLGRIAGRPLPDPAFLAINAVGVVLLIAGIRAAVRRDSAGWIAVAIATVVSTNAVLHLLGSIATGVYSPGLITAIVLYVPLGSLTLLRAADQMAPRAFGRGVSAGVAVHVLISMVAIAIARG
jgi:hypothetical protein